MKVRVESNINDQIQRLERIKRGMQTRIPHAMMTYGKTVMDTAKRNSLGTLSTATLRTYRPGFYSIRRSAPPLMSHPDFIINRQEGLFYNSWFVQQAIVGGMINTTVGNSAPYSFFMYGTSKMRPRPVLDKATEQIGPVYGFLSDEWKKVLNNA